MYDESFVNRRRKTKDTREREGGITTDHTYYNLAAQGKV